MRPNNNQRRHLPHFDQAEECEHPHDPVGRIIGIDAARVDRASDHENDPHENASAHRRVNRGCETPYRKVQGCARHRQQAIRIAMTVRRPVNVVRTAANTREKVASDGISATTLVRSIRDCNS